MDNVTKARINLFAVLRNIEDLCAMDPVSKDLIKDVKLGVEFNVPEVGSAVLNFADGKCTFTRGKGKSALKLYFTSPEHFNKLVDGEKPFRFSTTYSKSVSCSKSSPLSRKD